MKDDHILDILPKGWKKLGSGKVRELYTDPKKEYLLMLTTDRISAFDQILPTPIPRKGEVLNRLNAFFLEKSQTIVKNWHLSTPSTHTMLGYYCRPIAIECIVRGYLSGHAWRLYKKGVRQISDAVLSEGLFEHARLEKPVLTPTTKSLVGDQDTNRRTCIEQKLVTEKLYDQLMYYAEKLYSWGAAYAAQRGLILVDAKYEFGLRAEEIYLIDELHTPDSARYFYTQDYLCYLRDPSQKPRQLSKEALRQQLLTSSKAGTSYRLSSFEAEALSSTYLLIYEQLTGTPCPSIQSSQSLAQHIHTTIQRAESSQSTC